MSFKYDSINHAQQDAFDCYLRYLIAGEDLTNNVLRVAWAPLASSSYSATAFSNFGAAAAANVKGTPGAIVSVAATSINAAIRYLQIHNKATIPLSTEVPVFSFPLPAGSATVPSVLVLDSDFFMGGYYLSAGIGWAFSTTAGTYTAATASDHQINGLYI